MSLCGHEAGLLHTCLQGISPRAYDDANCVLCLTADLNCGFELNDEESVRTGSTVLGFSLSVILGAADGAADELAEGTDAFRATAGPFKSIVIEDERI